MGDSAETHQMTNFPSPSSPRNANLQLARNESVLSLNASGFDRTTARCLTTFRQLHPNGQALRGRLMITEETPQASNFQPSNGCIVTLTCANSFGVSWRNLETAIQKNADTQIVATLDHTKKRNPQLPSRVVLLDKPTLSASLMQLAPTIGLELPFAVQLVETVAGRVEVSYEDPMCVAERHNLNEQDALLTEWAELLRHVSSQAARPY